MDWDKFFMSMVYLCATKSRDSSSKLGSVIVGPDHAVRSTGYNGLPRGVDYKPERDVRPGKYMWYEHAERNSIYNAARIGVSTNGCTMYTNGVPCADCARAAVNAGISEVVVSDDWDAYRAKAEAGTTRKWGESCEVGRQILEEGGVKIRIYGGPVITEVSGFIAGESIKLKS